jgi:PKHD-type hydroxylase
MTESSFNLEHYTADYSAFPGVLDGEIADAILEMMKRYEEEDGLTTGAHMALHSIDQHEPDLSHLDRESMTKEEIEEVQKDLDAYKEYQKNAVHEEQVTYRSCKKYLLNVIQEAWLLPILQRFAEISNDKWMFDINHIDQMEILDYDKPDDGYKWHRDSELLNETERRTRKLTMIVQLSDSEEYEGCDLEISNEGVIDDKPTDTNVCREYQDTLRTKGTVIVFPSFQKHRITPLLSGNRKSLVAWVNGPVWR